MDNNNINFKSTSPMLRDVFYEQNQSDLIAQQYQQHQQYQELYQVQQQSQPLEFQNPQTQRKQIHISSTIEQEQSSLRFQSTSTEEGATLTSDRVQQQVQLFNQETARSERGFSFDQLFSENDPSEQLPQIQLINKNSRCIDPDRFMRECIPGGNFFQPLKQKSFRPQEQRQFITSEFTPTISQRGETNSFRFYSEFHEEIQPMQRDRWSNQQQLQYRFRQPSLRNIQSEIDQTSNCQTASTDLRKLQEFNIPCFKQLISCNNNDNPHKVFENVEESANIEALQAALDSQMNGEIQEIAIPSQGQEQQFQKQGNTQETPQNIDMENQELWQHNCTQEGFHIESAAPNSDDPDNLGQMLQKEYDNNNPNNNSNIITNLRQTSVVEIKKDKLDPQNKEAEAEEGFVFPWFMEIMSESKRSQTNSQTKIKTNKLDKGQGSKTELISNPQLTATIATDTAATLVTPEEKKKKVLQIELAVDKMVNRKRSKKTLFYLASDGKQKKFSRITKSMIRPVCNAVAKHMRNLGATVGRIDWVNQLRKFLLSNESCIPAAIDFFENHFENYVNNSQKLVEKSEYLMFKNNWIKGVSDPKNFHGLKSCCQIKEEEQEEEEINDQDGNQERKDNQ